MPEAALPERARAADGPRGLRAQSEAGGVVRRARRVDGGGVRPEAGIWHTLPLPPSDSNDESGPPAPEATGETRKVNHVHIAPPKGDAMSRPRAHVLLATAIALLTILLVGGAAFAWRFGAAREDSSRTGAVAGNQAVLLVAENGSVAIEPRAQALGPVVAALAPAAPAAPVEAAPAARESRPPPLAAPMPGARNALRPRSAVGGRRRALGGAPAPLHGVDAPAASTGEISLRFEVGVDGAARSVSVLPAAVGRPRWAHAWRRSAAPRRSRRRPRRSRFDPVTVQSRRRAEGEP